MFPLADTLGSTIALTDSTGTVQTQYTYDPFGGSSASGAMSTNTYQFTGRVNDGTGLYYYRARYYSPRFQRFVSEDPAGLLGGVNNYAYADNDPIALRDPFGLSTININITRTSSNDTSTTGTVDVSVDSGPSLFQGSTLEPSMNAPQTPASGPPVPIGQYPATVYNSPNEGYPDLLLGNTGSRTNIEIHKGNFHGDTRGCILVGTRAGQKSNLNNFVEHSKVAFNRIMNIVNSTQMADKKSGQQTTIIVNIGQQGVDPEALGPGID